MGNTIFVQVIKAFYGSWYSSKVGEIFEVHDKLEENLKKYDSPSYCVVGFGILLYIRHKDAKVLDVVNVNGELCYKLKSKKK